MTDQSVERTSAEPACIAIEWCDLSIDPVPVDFAGELHQFVLHADDLVEPARNRSPSPFVFEFCGRIVPSDATTGSCPAIRGNLENEFATLRGSAIRKLTSNLTPPKVAGLHGNLAAQAVCEGLIPRIPGRASSASEPDSSEFDQFERRGKICRINGSIRDNSSKCAVDNSVKYFSARWVRPSKTRR